MNDIAGSEILLILMFVLMFFGSKSIPGLARTMGRTIRQVKDATSEIQNEIKKSGEGMKKDLNLDGLIRETSEDIRRPLDQMANDLDNAVKYVPKKTNSHLNESRIVETPQVKPETTEIESNTNDTSIPEVESNEQK